MPYPTNKNSKGTTMRTPRKRSFILGSALSAALTLGGAATAGATSGQNDRAAATVTTTEDGTIVTKEKGIVIEGHGTSGRREAFVSVYENSLFGNFLQVSINDKHFGSKQRTKAFVVDGNLVAKVKIDGYLAVLKGTVVQTGEPVQLRDVMNDNNYKIITKGTNQPVLVDASLTYRGRTFDMSFETAFTYDLTVKKVPIGG